MRIRLKNIHESRSRGDGVRVLVEREWPFGIRREDLRIDLWLKDLAPSDKLINWYDNDPDRWEEFRSHYFEELDNDDDTVDLLLAETGQKTITLVYTSGAVVHSHATALKEYLEEKMLDRLAA